jgi:hypothetical protein
MVIERYTVVYCYVVHATINSSMPVQAERLLVVGAILGWGGLATSSPKLVLLLLP